MNIKKTFLAGLVMMGCLSASAQDAPKTEYVFTPHWYLQLQPIGAQYTLGEISFKNLVSYNVQAAIGYQFSSVVGARLSVNAWQSRAGWKKYADGADQQKWKWNYVNPAVDVTFNLSNLFCGFNPNRVFNFSVLGGLGANIGWKNDEAKTALSNINAAYNNLNGNQNMQYLWDGTKTRLMGHVGAAADFRISDAVSVGLEVTANTLNDHYNSKKAGNGDWYFNGLVGVKINLGKSYTTRTIKEPEPRVIERVVEKVVEKPVPVAETKPVAKPEFRRDVFFKINKVTIDESEAGKVKEVADFLKQNPDAKVNITGYADKGTGTAKINAKLADLRAQSITKTLTETYGIASSRITTDSMSDTVQPFTTNDQNRVSICIAK